MEQYIIFGTKTETTFSQNGDIPYIQAIPDKEAAICAIAGMCYGLIKTTCEEMQFLLPDPEQMPDFLAGDHPDNDSCEFLSDMNHPGLLYSDSALYNFSDGTDLIISLAKITDCPGTPLTEILPLDKNEILAAICDFAARQPGDKALKPGV